MASSSFPRRQGDAAGRFVERLAAALVASGTPVRVLAPDAPGASRRETMAGIEVVRRRYFWPRRLQRLAYGAGIPANLRHRPLAWLNLPFFLASFLVGLGRQGGRARLVHAHWGVLGALAVLVRPLHRRPVVVTVHGSDLHRGVAPPGVRGVTRFAVRRADAVLTPSLAFERVCREEGARDCRFVPHGVDGPGPQELAAAIEARRSRGADGAPVRLVSVGRLVPERRHALLLETLAALPPPGGEGELTLAGEGPERRRLEALARGLPPGWRVRLAGRVPAAEVARLLAGADLYLSATTVETFGLATLEAAAWGLPIVATAVGYPAELLAPDAARLVDAGDGLALGAALDGLLRAAEPRLALGRLARARFEEAALSWESAAGRTLAVYRSVLAARSRARDLR